MASFDKRVVATLKVGAIYKMKAPELINTDKSHYFIVTAINEDDNYIIVTTTQLDKKIEYFRKRELDFETLAYLSPTSENGFTVDTYVNCNDYFIINTAVLFRKESEGELFYSGRLCREEYERIASAINASRINDIPRFLLEYTED